MAVQRRPGSSQKPKVFKCPHCSFWASTASRFHVHIVGHLNKRPFQCSLCHYSSNWRWDITKHIRLKTVRDPTHEKAKVLLTDETGRRNYSKYNKYLTTMKMESVQQPPKFPKRILPRDGNPESSPRPAVGSKRPPESADENDLPPPKKKANSENKKTMWKCKKCHFRDGDREVVLEHVRDHYRNAAEGLKKKKKPGNKSATSPKDANISAENGDQSDGEVNGPEHMCETCPFTSSTWNELEAHSEKHFVCTLNRKQFKCQRCPYYAQDNSDLAAHSDSHKDADSQTDGKGGSMACTQCPYVANCISQLTYHRRRHNQPDSPHKCYKCSYGAPNNTILALHVRLHGRHNNSDQSAAAAASAAVHSTPEKASNVHSIVDISRTDTSILPEVPTVWVSKMNRLVKMYKCRFCPHLNMRKSNIVEHEKMHLSGASPSSAQIKCPDCSYTCSHAGVLASHSKVHQALNGLIVGVVDPTRAEDEQIEEMKKRLQEFETSQPSEYATVATFNGESDLTPVKEKNDQDQRILCFCSMCPARFLFEKDMKIHMRFHELKLLYKCESCSYTARQKTHVETHYKVHTDDYQERTRSLVQMYDIDAKNPQPKIANISNNLQVAVWIVASDEPNEKDKNDTDEPFLAFKCSKCPAEFFKSFTLSYHETLHGGPGTHKCKYCDYAVKTYGNLLKHEMVHKGQKPLRSSKVKSESNVPMAIELVPRKIEGSRSPAKSPPLMDPEFGLLIHGNPSFTYATYVKNGKVKEKRYKCHKCPSAFEKRDQYKIHLSLHGSKQRYSCDRCDYAVKYYANFVQHIKKHEANDTSQKDGKRALSDNEDEATNDTDDTSSLQRRSVDRCSKAMKLLTADEQAIMLMQQKNIMAQGGLLPNNSNDVISRCPHCPYTNNRKDGVASHIRCHSNPRGGPYVCKYCDYTVPQQHFLRDHMKVHFNQPKFLKPDAYMKVERMEIWAEPVDPASSKPKFLVFKDSGERLKNDRFLPKLPQPVSNDDKTRTYINMKTAEEDVEQLDQSEENPRSRRVRKNHGAASQSSEQVDDEDEDDDYNPQDDGASVRTMDDDSEAKTDPGHQDQPATESSKSAASSDTELSDTSSKRPMPNLDPPSAKSLSTSEETTEQRLNE